MASLTDDGDIRRIGLIDEAACRAQLARLDAARASWIRRGTDFHTLGAATYLDACGASDPLRYASNRARCNPVLERCFSQLLETVRATLEGVYGAACRFHGALALPGFHIFLGRSLSGAMRDNLHLDLQHSHLDPAFAIDSPSFTFTLPLELPRAGGGIEICRAAPGDKRGAVTEYEYRCGELFLHSGRALHRRMHRAATGACRRITLQGHGVWSERHWVIYW
ncbi:hypothetical protein U1839_20790 [Sphingomonas sp. RT2P30]|uniref:hypothetical protein n=1 Tax=Parasphingomonas halimpatiens TaxID=3096162 RepID=UPI002FC5C0B4